MAEYFDSALFVYSREGESYVKPLVNNPFGVNVKAVTYEIFIKDIPKIIKDYDCVIISGGIAFIKTIAQSAIDYNFSIGVLPLLSQKKLLKSLSMYRNVKDLVDEVLQNNVKAVDIITCNDKILLFQATIGNIPLVDIPEATGKMRIFLNGFKVLSSLKLLPFSITVLGEKKTVVDTAAAGCFIAQRHKKSFAARLIQHDSSPFDGMISLLIVAPMSVIDYLSFMFQTLFRSERSDTVQPSTGYIKSSEIIVDTEAPMKVDIDGESVTETPVHCKVLKKVLKFNFSHELLEEERAVKRKKPRLDIRSLPAGRELLKAKNKKIPFFAYASEERFKDLFVALREDADLNALYFILMMLSTILATVGLYLNSSSVIIGAMILAPLMAPIVSLAMGLLRGDKHLFNNSLLKIVLGVVVSLAVAALLTLAFQYKPITEEMEARLRPSVLDLLVAITAGVAGAYTKSYREILQSLAGVAIAVALVPPLAVAGIGIGRLDVEFFSQAFLLFSTNFIGIVLAATFTFRLLGYSPVVKSKQGIGVVTLLLVLICIPLYHSYNMIATTSTFEKSWKDERFLVHGKYLIIKKARLSEVKGLDVLTVTILTREQLNRSDLAEFKRKVRHYFPQDLVIRASVIYIL